MQPVVSLTIGGIAFRLPAGLGLMRSDWPSVYHGFLCHDAAGQGMPAVDVEFSDDLSASLDDAEFLFDAERSWTAYRLGHERILVHQPHGAVEWAARFAPADSRAVIIAGRSPTTGGCALQYPLDQVLLMYLLARMQGLILHATGLLYEERMLVFPACSGGGKSTLASMLSEARLGTAISDDRMIVRCDAEPLMAWGSPWPGTERIAHAASAPGAGLLFLEQGPNAIEPLDPAEALARLLPVTSLLTFEKEELEAQLGTCAMLVQQLPCYRFSFRPDSSAVATLRKWLREDHAWQV